MHVKCLGMRTECMEVHAKRMQNACERVQKSARKHIDKMYAKCIHKTHVEMDAHNF